MVNARLAYGPGWGSSMASWIQMLVDFSSGTGLQWGCCVLLPPWLRGTIESVVVGGGRWVVDKLCPSWWFPAIVCEDLSGCSGCLKGGWCSRGGGQVSDCCCCCVWRLALQDGQAPTRPSRRLGQEVWQGLNPIPLVPRANVLWRWRRLACRNGQGGGPSIL